jgi:hypothetical protein
VKERRQDLYYAKLALPNVNESHEEFIGSWDAFTTTRSVTDNATTTDTFTDVEPEENFQTH